MSAQRNSHEVEKSWKYINTKKKSWESGGIYTQIEVLRELEERENNWRAKMKEQYTHRQKCKGNQKNENTTVQKK